MNPSKFEETVHLDGMDFTVHCGIWAVLRWFGSFTFEWYSVLRFGFYYFDDNNHNGSFGWFLQAFLHKINKRKTNQGRLLLAFFFVCVCKLQCFIAFRFWFCFVFERGIVFFRLIWCELLRYCEKNRHYSLEKSARGKLKMIFFREYTQLHRSRNKLCREQKSHNVF